MPKALIPILSLAAVVLVSLLAFMYTRQVSQAPAAPLIDRPQDIAPAPSPSPSLSVVEQYCLGVKADHLSHCGYVAPEENHECRTTHADHAYEECLATTTPEDAATELSDEEGENIELEQEYSE